MPDAPLPTIPQPTPELRSQGAGFLTLGGALAVAGLALYGYGVWQVQEWRYAAKDRDRIAAAQELKRNNERAATVASTGYETRRAAAQTVAAATATEVNRAIESKPDFSAGQCLDADGLRILRAAAAGADPGQPGPAVP